MKILGRILYALIVAVLLILVGNFSNSVTSNKYFENEVQTAYDNNHEDKYRMIYGSLGFHKKEATYEYNINGYQIQFFEIEKLFVRENKDKTKDYLVEKYLYIMIDHETEILTIDNPQRFYMRFNFVDDFHNTEMVTYRVHQFKKLPVSVVVDNDDGGLIPFDFFTNKDKSVINFELFDYNDDTKEEVILAKSNTNFLESDLVSEEFLIENYTNEETLNNAGIYFKYQANKKPYVGYAVLIYSLYALGVIITGYFFFFFKRKKLGKNEPSEHF